MYSQYFNYFLLPRSLSQEPPNVTVIICGSATIAETNDDFVCATIDWWPSEKCNYNQCPWGGASVLDLDLHHPLLANAIQEEVCCPDLHLSFTCLSLIGR